MRECGNVDFAAWSQFDGFDEFNYFDVFTGGNDTEKIQMITRIYKR